MIGNVSELTWDGDPPAALRNATPRVEFIDYINFGFVSGPLALGPTIQQNEDYGHYGYGDGAGPISPYPGEPTTEGPVANSLYVGFRLIRTARVADYTSRGQVAPDTALR